MRLRHLSFVLAASMVALGLGGAAAQAAPAVAHRTIISIGANQSSNWSGYNVGALERKTVFHQISGYWNVPAAKNHQAGKAAYSSTWVGIGGGCVDASCNVGDDTLIQAGTEQDVNAAGVASYSAWWELIPAPSVKISGMTIHAGDRMFVNISEAVTGSNVWIIVVKNLTTGTTWSKTVPYSSSHATAEWIEETPVVAGTGGVQIGPLPNLGTVNFDLAKLNGANPKLGRAEEMQLQSGSSALATPSRPDSDTDGFNDCTWATSCAAPTS